MASAKDWKLGGRATTVACGSSSLATTAPSTGAIHVESGSGSADDWVVDCDACTLGFSSSHSRISCVAESNGGWAVAIGVFREAVPISLDNISNKESVEVARSLPLLSLSVPNVPSIPCIERRMGGLLPLALPALCSAAIPGVDIATVSSAVSAEKENNSAMSSSSSSSS